MKHIYNINNTIKGLIAVSFMFIVGIAQVSAVTYRTSNASGNWSTGSNWTSTGSGSPVVYKIASSHTITLDVNASGFDTLIINGTLSFGGSKTMTLNSGGAVLVNNTGAVAITGGNGSSQFLWASSSATITGPFNGSNEIGYGPRYATAATAAAASTVQGAFVFGLISLPISLVEFGVKETSTGFVAEWTATGEPVFASFILEVSTDGMNYNTVATVPVQSEGGLVSYSHNIAGTAKAMYVRISLSQNGSVHKFNTVFVSRKTAANQDIKLYPTVVTQSTASLNVLAPVAGVYTVNVYDASLQTVGSIQMNAAYANEVMNLEAATAGLNNSGIYYVVITNADGATVKTPIIVQR